MIAASCLLAFACLFLLLAIHPFITYPLSLSLLAGRRKQGPKAAPAGTTASFAICVCAYNEEAVIGQKIRNMLDLRAAVGALDILVYVDAATDRTAELLEPFRDQVTVIVSPQRRGKTHGMNLLVAETKADIVVFTDANVMIRPNAIEALARRFRDPQVGCVCGHLTYTNGSDSATAEVGSVYWRLEEHMKRSESRFGYVMGADGSLFAIRRHLHRPVPANLIDDMFLSLSILCDGYKILSAEDALAFESSVTASHEEFRRKVRIACQAFNVHRALWPRLRKLPALAVYMYLSHKFLRWIAAANLALSAILGAAGLAMAGAPPLVLAGVALAGIVGLTLGARFKIGPIASIAEILLALVGALWGVVRSLAGYQFQTWTPAASIRRLPTDGADAIG